MKNSPIRPGLTGFITASELNTYLANTRGRRTGTITAKPTNWPGVFLVSEHSPKAA